MASKVKSTTSTKGFGGGNGKDSNNSLVVVVLDVSPMAWGEHDLKRTALDKSRLASGKRCIGPAILEEILDSIQAFGNAITLLERDSAFAIIGVADNETAIVYPRKDKLAAWLNTVNKSGGTTAEGPNTRTLKEDLITGVTELIHRASQKAEFQTDPAARHGCMAAGFSIALCTINRFLVTAKAGGVSALRTEHYMERVDDEGVIALMGKGDKKKSGGGATTTNKKRISAWDPRILLIQVSDDRSRDYNAFMNCSFAAAKHHIVVDGCYLSSNVNSNKTCSSAFLEQAVDLTGGVFLAPSGAAQVGGALTEVFFSVFLAPLSCRPLLNLPALNKVDFRARCFESGDIVDMAYVCNQCLSIFKNKPIKGYCLTCEAKIIDYSSHKRRKDE